MVVRRGGKRRKARGILSKRIRTKGKLSITRYLQEFEPGSKVVLKIEPSYQSGDYHRRFHGRHGTIVGKRGRHYIVEFSDFGKKKRVILHPVHLKKA